MKNYGHLGFYFNVMEILCHVNSSILFGCKKCIGTYECKINKQ